MADFLTPQAGAPIRAMERRRRRKSNQLFWASCIVLTFAAILLCQYLPGSDSSLFSIWNLAYKTLFIAAIVLLMGAGAWFRRAGYADRGALGEEQADILLTKFCEKYGWRKEANLRPQGLRGDIDFVLVNESGSTVVCIEVKNHSAERLESNYFRRDLEKMLRRSRAQAVYLKRDRNLRRFVHCVLCFISVNDSLQKRKWIERGGVNITSLDSLEELLLTLDGR